jgi:hypothetical protein
VTAAIFGLVGVVVGGVLNGLVNVLLQGRADRSTQRSAALLVRTELVRSSSLALAAAQRPPEELPQLQNITPVLWQSQRATLARGFSDDDWTVVARAYAHVDALASVLVFTPEGTLEPWRAREAPRLLAGMVEDVQQAAVTLGRVAGLPSDEAATVPYFAEGGPVAA